MKKTLLAFTLIAAFAACKKTSIEEPVVVSPVEEVEVENTTFFVSRIKNENTDPITPVANGTYNLLGYGYDINGRYSDSSSIRGQVIDMQKFDAFMPGSAATGLPRESGSPYIVVGKDAETFSQLLSNSLDATKTLKVFKSSITSLPDSSALSKKYIYARAMYYAYQKRAYLFVGPLDPIASVLSNAFITDINILTPAALVKKYGTHVMRSIRLGLKLEIIYQAETNKQDREGKALVALSRATRQIFGLESGHYFSGPAYINSNTNQKVYFKTFGGNPAALPQFPADNTTNPRIDFNNWFQSSTVENSSLIDLPSDGLTPLYDFVLDPVKKANLKTYIDQYIQENSVRMIN